MHIAILIQGEMYDNEKEEFYSIEPRLLHFEHSLYTISKWEAKHHKAFLEVKQFTTEELMSYIYFMIVEEDIPEYIVNFISQEDHDRISKFIHDPMTATVFGDKGKENSYHSEKVTSELVYYWMLSNQIPVEFEHWHLSRLLTLLRVFSIKNTPPKKRSAREIMASNASLNAQRRAALHSKG